MLASNNRGWRHIQFYTTDDQDDVITHLSKLHNVRDITVSVPPSYTPAKKKMSDMKQLYSSTLLQRQVADNDFTSTTRKDEPPIRHDCR